MGGKGTQNAGTCTGVVIVVENLETLTVALQYASVPKFCHATDSRLIQDISTSCLPLVCQLFATRLPLVCHCCTAKTFGKRGKTWETQWSVNTRVPCPNMSNRTTPQGTSGWQVMDFEIASWSQPPCRMHTAGNTTWSTCQCAAHEHGTHGIQRDSLSPAWTLACLGVPTGLCHRRFATQISSDMTDMTSRLQKIQLADCLLGNDSCTHQRWLLNVSICYFNQCPLYPSFCVPRDVSVQGWFRTMFELCSFWRFNLGNCTSWWCFM